MKLSTYCAERSFNPAYMAIINKKGQHELDLLTMEPWKQWHMVEHDLLAYRQLLKAREGWETLHNHIRGQHGLPNRY